MSAINDILGSIDQLKKEQQEISDRRKVFEKERIEVQRQLDAIDNDSRVIDDKVTMLETMAIALKDELKARETAAVAFMSLMDDLPDIKNQFVDFMKTQDVDLRENLVQTC